MYRVFIQKKNGSSSRGRTYLQSLKMICTNRYTMEPKQQDSTMSPNTVSRLLHISLWKKSLCNRLDGCGKIYSSAVYPIRHNTPNGQRILYKIFEIEIQLNDIVLLRQFILLRTEPCQPLNHHWEQREDSNLYAPKRVLKKSKLVVRRHELNLYI